MDTSLCYIEHAGCYLMLYRNKKPSDPNAGKWLGIGGKFLPGETPEECARREILEETGLVPATLEARGVVYFVNDAYPDEDMYLFTGTLAGDPAQLPPVPECNEGTLAWIPKERIPELQLWEGDRYFLEALAAGRQDIRMTLTYHGYDLVSVEDAG